ncbi:MAG: cell surface glycoprotein (s-layer protein) related protein [Crocinitomicaceae bacterium]|jgi:hypothetical protein|nr:cell surface glycoprotein (s-layer protein) related protein [Crocinitomicaceae bacterium]
MNQHFLQISIKRLLENTVVLFVFAAALISPFNGNAQGNEQANAQLAKSSQQFFIENKGQWPEEVLYLARMGGLDAWITKKGVLYTFYKLEKKKENTSLAQQIEILDKFDQQSEMRSIIGHRVWAKFQNANTDPGHESKQKLEGYYNYLIGNDPGKHASNVGLYKEVLVKNVYTGIDARYYFDGRNLRYDYIVYPGADYRQIQVQLEGALSSKVKDKDLVFTTRFGEVKQAELYVYQDLEKKRQAIGATWQKKGENYGFLLSNYDPTKPVVIDPLIYSTYIGAANYNDEGYSIAVDASGNAYVTGRTNSATYDITPGAFDNSLGGHNAFVTKLNTSGTALIYSTFMGGDIFEVGNFIVVDDLGNSYVTGSTISSDYPIVAGAFQNTNGGSHDVFVSKLNATGTALVYSTYVGGSGNDVGRGIALDASGNAYIIGYTSSSNYDVTAGVFQSTKGGVTDDVFVTKLNATGSALLYSTYIGGSGTDLGRAIALDASGNAYITGSTASSNYDVTPGVFQAVLGANKDIFVTKLDSTGTALLYSTYIGGSGYEDAYSIAIDTSGNAYVTGWTESADYDVTPGAFQSTNEGYSDIFVTKLSPNGDTLVYSTYMGGSSYDRSTSIQLDASGNAYVAGGTSSINFDITPGAFQTSCEVSGDVFASKLSPMGIPIYSTFIGGSWNDMASALVLDASGVAYITGSTYSTDFDISPGAFQSTNNQVDELYFDVFVTKICLDYPLSTSLMSAPETDNQIVCMNTGISSIVYVASGSTGASFSGLPAGVNASWNNDTITISGTPTEPGVFNYQLNILGNCGATISGTITVPLIVTANASVTNVCAGTQVVLSGSGWDGASYSWTGGVIDGVAFVPLDTTTYIVTATDTNNCTNTDSITVNVSQLPLPTVSASASVTTICAGASVTLTGGGAQSYSWSGGISDGVSFTPFATTTYIVTGTDANMCFDSASITIQVNPLPLVTAFTTATTICAGSPVTLTGGGALSYSWTGGISNGVAFTPSATASYTVTGTDINNCSNTASRTITVNALPNTATTANGLTISAILAGAAYQWIDCDNNNTAIPNQTNRNFTTAVNGNYAVIITQNGCSDTSACITINTVGITGPGDIKNLTVYPNPNNGTFTISAENEGKYSLVNELGQTVREFELNAANKYTAPVKNLSTGVYYIVGFTNTEVFKQKVIVTE